MERIRADITHSELFLTCLGCMCLGLLTGWGVFSEVGLFRKYWCDETAANWAAAMATFVAVLVAIFAALAPILKRDREQVLRARALAAVFAPELEEVRDYIAGCGRALLEGNDLDSEYNPQLSRLAMDNLVRFRKSMAFAKTPALDRFHVHLPDFAPNAAALLIRAHFEIEKLRDHVDLETSTYIFETVELRISQYKTTVAQIDAALMGIRAYRIEHT